MALSFAKDADERFLKAVADLRKEGVSVTVTTRETNLGRITRSVELDWVTHNHLASLDTYLEATS